MGILQEDVKNVTRLTNGNLNATLNIAETLPYVFAVVCTANTNTFNSLSVNGAAPALLGQIGTLGTNSSVSLYGIVPSSKTNIACAGNAVITGNYGINCTWYGCSGVDQANPITEILTQTFTGGATRTMTFTNSIQNGMLLGGLVQLNAVNIAPLTFSANMQIVFSYPYRFTFMGKDYVQSKTEAAVFYLGGDSSGDTRNLVACINPGVDTFVRQTINF